MARFRTPRSLALAIVVVIVAVGGVAYGFTVASGDPAAAPTTTTTATTRPTTTTTEAPTTTTTAPPTTTTTGPRADDGVLERGERGDAVAALQRRLAELHFDAGIPDGSFGLATVYAVQGFQKLAGLAPDGKV